MIFLKHIFSNKQYIKNIIPHLKVIHTHRKWVRKYCFKLGLYWQGLTHDLSKYSPTEFLESIKYYDNGVGSPINKCKAINFFSYAWLHHRGRNKHHREYWTDYYDSGLKCIAMPKKYAMEMICDFLAAAHTYNKKSDIFEMELEWFKKQLNNNIVIHPKTANFVLETFELLSKCGVKSFTRKNLDEIFNKAYFDSDKI